jgi:chorismate-pyruvate lyase
MKRAAAALAIWSATAIALLPAATAQAWPDTFTARLEALALLQTLNAELLSHDSATQTLGQWCADHRLAAEPKIVAQRVRSAAPAESEQLRRELRVAPGDELRFRHVRLICGSLVLSEADNWYVPGRLSTAMNAQLESSDVPFGVVVRDLHFQRHTLAARLLWQPLAPGWEMDGPVVPQGAAPNQAHAAAEALAVPPAVLEHRALLALPDGTPISEVVETYSGNVLAFPPPQSAARR